MKQNEALDYVASCAYNVGYGAKKNLATYDIVEKIPGWISFVSIAFGILSLKYFSVNLSTHAGVFLTIFGVISLYITHFLSIKDEYKEAGTKFTRIFDELHVSYRKIKGSEECIDEEMKNVKNSMDNFYKASIERQILFSDWYAHYKFFVQMQIDWIDERKQFKLLKDKIPRSFQFVAVIFILIMVVYIVHLKTNFLKCIN